MFCPNCGRKLADQETICPGCGESVPMLDELLFHPEEPAAPRPELPLDAPAEEPAEETLTEPPVEVPAEEIPAEPSEAENAPEETESPAAEEPVETEKLPVESAEPEEAPKKKKASPAAIILSVVIALLVIVVVCLTIVVTTLSKTGSMPAFVTNITEYIEEKSFKPEAVALNITDAEGNLLSAVSNEVLNYYYWGEFYYYVQASGLPFDPAQPLDEQAYDDTMSWQDYFLANANISLIQIESIKAEAKEVDYQMPEDYQAEFDATFNGMADYAASAGFVNDDGTGDVLAYIQDSYGSGATVEGFREYLYDSYYVTAYSDQIYADLVFTDDEIEAYFDENADLFAAYAIEKSDLPNVNVRHILITPESAEDGTVSDEAWEAAETAAQRILTEWAEGDATEDTFGQLANTYSTDPGSNTVGGLYEDVYPGQMVETFNDWCFDSVRNTGDTGIVKTDYGYHIMYFVSATENFYWKDAAESELRYTGYQEVITSITAPYSTAATEKMQLASPTAVDSMVAALDGTAE